MSKYLRTYVLQLKQETHNRFRQLIESLEGKVERFKGAECLNLNGSKIRIAVDDFKTILSEIRRLK